MVAAPSCDRIGLSRQDWGHRKRILEPHPDIIVQRLAENPHLTLHGLTAELSERGISVSHNTIREFVRSEELR